MTRSHDTSMSMVTERGLSHDPVGGNPVLPSRKDSYGCQELLVGNVNILIDDGGIKIVAIELLNSGRFLGTLAIVIILMCVCV